MSTLERNCVFISTLTLFNCVNQKEQRFHSNTLKCLLSIAPKTLHGDRRSYMKCSVDLWPPPFILPLLFLGCGPQFFLVLQNTKTHFQGGLQLLTFLSRSLNHWLFLNIQATGRPSRPSLVNSSLPVTSLLAVDSFTSSHLLSEMIHLLVFLIVSISPGWAGSSVKEGYYKSGWRLYPLC